STTVRAPRGQTAPVKRVSIASTPGVSSLPTRPTLTTPSSSVMSIFIVTTPGGRPPDSVEAHREHREVIVERPGPCAALDRLVDVLGLSGSASLGSAE